MNYSCVLLVADAHRARRQRRPRQDHRGARELDLRRPRDAVRSDQVRQRPEPGRRAGQHPGARQRHPGHLPGRLRIGEAGIPDAARLIPLPACGTVGARSAPGYGPGQRHGLAWCPLTGRARESRKRPLPASGEVEQAARPCYPADRGCEPAVLSPVILIPAVLNGLLTGAVYALVALGLTLIYGVLHIINFAHGALLTAAMFAAFFAHRLLGLDPYRRGARCSRRCSSRSATRCSASSSARPRTARTATSCW